VIPSIRIDDKNIKDDLQPRSSLRFSFAFFAALREISFRQAAKPPSTQSKISRFAFSSKSEVSFLNRTADKLN